MFREIVPTLSAEGAESFAHEVFDRFSNPFIRHELFDITLQATMKMRVRNVPTILRYAERNGSAPPSFAFGLAAFLTFMRGELQAAGRAQGKRVPGDDQAGKLARLWSDTPGRDAHALNGLARAFLADSELWETDLTAVPGLQEAVAGHLRRIEELGAREALAQHLREVPA
jgi:tagaturonate reductase